MSTYPIIQSNTPIGVLEVLPDGLYTVFSARCEAVAERLRLAVFGHSGSAYLGLMLPEAGDELTLCRRLTRLERSRLPDPILFAAEESWQPGEARPEPKPVPAPPAPESSLWRPAPDGTLRRREAGREYAAVPAERVRAPGLPRELLVTIQGREYLVFPL